MSDPGAGSSPSAASEPPVPAAGSSAAPLAAGARRNRWVNYVDRSLRITRRILVDKVARDHHQSDRAFRRRRIVAAVTLVVGATLLGLSFSVEFGQPEFYPLTIALAATWVIGSLVSGPLHLGHIEFRGSLRRPVLMPILLGLLLGLTFVVGGLIFRRVPVLASYTENVLGYAREGIWWIVLLITIGNGFAEELFFRGALFAAIGRRHPVLISTAIYTLVTVASGNPVLVFAALVLGVVVGLQRRAAGGVLGPILTHVTWSATMLLILPPLFAAR
ncbi:MAG: CPBP family intramembrane glutamic endopeptidase [Propionibacteriaceae bacterium]